MIRPALILSLLVLLSDAGLAAQKPKKKKASTPKPKAAAPIAPEVKPPEPPPPPPPPPPADADLAVFGAELEERDGGLAVTGVLDDSHASELPLRAGDVLTAFNGAPVATRAQAAAAWRGLGYQARASAVVVRALSTEHLEGDAPTRDPEFRRATPTTLSTQELALRDKRLADAGAAADSELKKSLTDFVIEANQSVWARFPKGIPADAKPGDVLEALTATPVMADANLDFMSLPPNSRLWAKLLDVKGPAQTRNLRLFFFKLQPLGRGYYAAAGRVKEISGDQRAIKASAGGTIVLPPETALPADIRVRVEFVDPIVLTEPADYFQAGPGLWIASEGSGYKVAKTVPGRAGENAGIAAGEALVTVNGRFIENYDFSEAIGMLYGRQGEAVKVGISRVKGGKLETHDLARGMLFKDGASSPVDRPVMVRTKGAPAAPAPGLSEDSDKALDSLIQKDPAPKKN